MTGQLKQIGPLLVRTKRNRRSGYIGVVGENGMAIARTGLFLGRGAKDRAWHEARKLALAILKLRGTPVEGEGGQ